MTDFLYTLKKLTNTKYEVQPNLSYCIYKHTCVTCMHMQTYSHTPYHHQGFFCLSGKKSLSEIKCFKCVTVVVYILWFIANDGAVYEGIMK